VDEEEDEVMTDEHADEVRKHLKGYIGVFVALIVLTVVTVAARNLAVGVTLSVAIALLIATVKGSLVGAFFMHLAWEKRTIYAVLLLAGAFLFSMMGLLIWSMDSKLEGTDKAPIEAIVKDQPAPESH
jgi:cytochrome c oxidase subunit 4